MNDITELLDWRYATKKFSDKKITDEDWQKLEKALIKSPSSYGLQPWHFTVVTQDVLKEKLSPAAFGQEQITTSSHLVVLSARKNIDKEFVAGFIDTLSTNNGAPRTQFEEYEGMINAAVVDNELMHNGQQFSWAQRQVYIPMGFLLMTAASLGIDACPMEGFLPEQFDDILGLTKGDFSSTALVALGYRSEDDGFQHMNKTRFDRDLVLTMR